METKIHPKQQQTIGDKAMTDLYRFLSQSIADADSEPTTVYQWQCLWVDTVDHAKLTVPQIELWQQLHKKLYPENYPAPAESLELPTSDLQWVQHPAMLPRGTRHALVFDSSKPMMHPDRYSTWPVSAAALAPPGAMWAPLTNDNPQRTVQQDG